MMMRGAFFKENKRKKGRTGRAALYECIGCRSPPLLLLFHSSFQDAEQPYVGTAAGLQGCIKRMKKEDPENHFPRLVLYLKIQCVFRHGSSKTKICFQQKFVLQEHSISSKIPPSSIIHNSRQYQQVFLFTTL